MMPLVAVWAKGPGPNEPDGPFALDLTPLGVVHLTVLVDQLRG